MSTLFINYSTKDRSTAEIFDTKLVEMGYEKPFRDDHPDAGIPAGAEWERELYRKRNRTPAPWPVRPRRSPFGEAAVGQRGRGLNDSLPNAVDVMVNFRIMLKLQRRLTSSSNAQRNVTRASKAAFR